MCDHPPPRCRPPGQAIFIYGYTFAENLDPQTSLEGTTPSRSTLDPNYLKRSTDLSQISWQDFRRRYRKVETYLHLDADTTTETETKAGEVEEEEDLHPKFLQLLGYPKHQDRESTNKTNNDRNIVVRLYSDKTIFLEHLYPSELHQYGEYYSRYDGIPVTPPRAIVTYKTPTWTGGKEKSRNFGTTSLIFREHEKAVRFLNKPSDYLHEAVRSDEFPNKLLDPEYPYNICTLCGQKFNTSYERTDVKNETCIFTDKTKLSNGLDHEPGDPTTLIVPHKVLYVILYKVLFILGNLGSLEIFFVEKVLIFYRNLPFLGQKHENNKKKS